MNTSELAVSPGRFRHALRYLWDHLLVLQILVWLGRWAVGVVLVAVVVGVILHVGVMGIYGIIVGDPQPLNLLGTGFWVGASTMRFWGWMFAVPLALVGALCLYEYRHVLRKWCRRTVS